jgi:hypothetical protein
MPFEQAYLIFRFGARRGTLRWDLETLPIRSKFHRQIGPIPSENELKLTV